MKALDELKNCLDESGIFGKAGAIGVNYMRDTVNPLIHAIEKELEERYIELPLDKDGVPIHIGDEMDCGEHFGVQEVEGFIHSAVAFTVCDPQPARICTCPAHMTRHYHKPTVEDVLHDFAIACEDAGNAGDTVNRLIDEYAERLQLKEEQQ